MALARAEVLVVGAGITGSALARYVSGVDVRLTYWEKSRDAGGRFSTVRSREAGAAILDHGAQYITRGAGRSPDGALYDTLLEHEVIQPFTGVVAGARPDHVEKNHFVCRDGMSSIATHLLTAAGVAVEFERRALNFRTVGEKWRVSDTDGRSADFDAVVITVPTPQLLEFEGPSLQALLAPHREALTRVAERYSMRYAACVYFDETASSALHAMGWASKYVKPNEAGTTGICYISIENEKRSLEKGAAPAVMLHSSVPFGIQHQDSKPESVLETMISDMHKTIPNLPTPVNTKLHRWRYSQVPTPEAFLLGGTGVVPGAEDGAMLLRDADGGPPLVLAGDGFAGSNFDNCMWSARAASAKLQTLVGTWQARAGSKRPSSVL